MSNLPCKCFTLARHLLQVHRHRPKKGSKRSYKIFFKPTGIMLFRRKVKEAYIYMLLLYVPNRYPFSRFVIVINKIFTIMLVTDKTSTYRLHFTSLIHIQPYGVINKLRLDLE